MASTHSWERVAALFEQALEVAAADRAEWLAKACPDDDLRGEVDKLLAAHERTEGVLDRPVEALAREALDQAAGAAAPNEQVGPYRVVCELGRGGMGVVYRAEDPRLGRQVALKFLSPYLNASESAKQRLLAEARAASALDHPNICTIYDVGETGDGRLYLAMAYYEGETLAARLERGPLPLDEAISIALQVAGALEHAHRSGIVHRDVKPSNILLTGRGGLKILDFGLAKQASIALTDPGTRLGTVAYMSPEQAMGQPVDHRTDIWALGVVFYEMATGRKPFSQPEPQGVLYAIVNESPQPPAPGPPGWWRIVRKSLEKKREDRYQQVGQMAQDLAAFGRSEVLPSEPEPVAVALDGAFDSLAVLPFAAAGGPETEYLGDGIAESLINSFSRISGLRVIPRSRAFRYKGSDADPQEIGRQLGVRIVLTGRVVERGDRLNVQTDLVDVAGDRQLCCERFHRKMSEIFEVEEEIARHIVDKLSVRLGREDQKRLARRYTEDTEAYQLYLKGRYHWGERTAASLQRAAAYFEEAIAKDSGYALAYAGLADCCVVLGFFAIAPPQEVNRRALAAARKAVEIDPELAEAHTALGIAKLCCDWDWAAAEAAFRRAIELNSGYWLAHDWYGMWLAARGRSEEAIAEINRALELEPLSLVIHHHAAWFFILGRRYEQALEHCRRVLDLDPDYALGHFWRGIALEQKSMGEEAVAALERALALLPGTQFAIAALGHACGKTRPERAHQIWKEWEELPRRGYVDPYGTALILAGLGELDRAMAQLDRACEDRSTWVALWAKCDPRLDPLRNHPRFSRVLQRIGVEDESTKTFAFGQAASRRSVGREREFQQLQSAAEGLARGSGMVVCVTGEPGMGKTTLVEDFLAGLTANPASYFTARGRCSERLAGSEAYLPVLEALESLVEGEARELVVRVMKEKAPTWYVQLAPVAAGSDASFTSVLADAKVASQERMKREFTVFFQELSRRRPVVLFCDDLHWADFSTVDLLSYLGSRCDALRLLVLATYRPSDLQLAKHPFLQAQRELQGRGLCREISLDFLGERDIARYLELEFPDHRFPSFLVSLIRSRTEGNPLFVVDLVRYLRDRGIIAEREGHWVLAQSAQQIQRDLPESIRGLIARKLDRLEEKDRRLLDAAAVQGQEFDCATVARVLDLDVSLVEERLEDLGRLHRLVHGLEEKEFPDGTLTQRYGFVHVLYQNALYHALPARRKAAWSAAVAEALLAFWGQDSGRVALDLGYLFEAARQFDRAADHFLLAARHAASLYANEEAALLASRAIASARKLRGPERLPRLLEAANCLGRLHMTLSRLPEALADFELAEKTAAEIGEVETHVNAICSAALVLFNTRQADRTREYAGRALQIARAAGSERAAASAEVVLALERLSYGATDEAEERFHRSVPILQEKGPPLHAMEALGFAGLMHAWELDYEAADRDVNWTFRRAHDLGAPYLVIMNLFVRGMARFNQGRLSEGLHDLQEGMRLAELNNERYWLTRYPNTLGWAYRELQDLETALRYDAEGVQAARDNRYPKPHAFSHLNLANDYMTLGEAHRALEHLQESERIFNLDFWFRWRYSISLNAQIARYWLRRGETQKAGQYAAESLAVAEPRRQRKHAAWAHKLLGDVAVAEERFAEARQEYEAALRTLRGHRCPTIEWKILLAAAEMAAACRDVPLSERYRGRCRAVIQDLVESLTDERLRQRFLRSEAISRALM